MSAQAGNVARLLSVGSNSPIAKQMRLDNWVNGLTGLGTGRDKTTFTLPALSVLLTPLILEALYHGSDIAALVVSALPDEAFKKRPKIVAKSAIAKAFKKYPDPPDNASPGIKQQAIKNRFDAVDDLTGQDAVTAVSRLESRVKEVGLFTKLHEAMTWGRLYGLGSVYFAADDGNEDWMPLDKTRIKGITALTVLDKRDVTPWRWYANIKKPKFGDIALYMMQPVGVFMGAPYDLESTNEILMVHESRMVRFGGQLTSKRERLRNQGADYSVLQKCFRALQLVENNWQSVGALLADASQGVWKIKGLIDMLALDPAKVQERFAFDDMIRSVIRGLVLDAENEDFTRVATPLAGIEGILKQSWLRLASAARMPATKLMGQSPAGMDATGDSDTRMWYDSVASTQTNELLEPTEYALQLLALADGLPEPEEYTVIFPPLWLLSDKERAETNFIQSQSDNLDIQNGMATPEEKAISRWGGGEFSTETKIDVAARQRIMALGIQQAQVEAETALANAINPPPPPPAVDGVIEGGHPIEGELIDTKDPKPPGDVEN